MRTRHTLWMAPLVLVTAGALACDNVAPQASSDAAKDAATKQQQAKVNTQPAITAPTALVRTAATNTKKQQDNQAR